MALTTVPVTITCNDQNGNPVAGAEIAVTLSKTEIYNGFVVPELYEATANASGVAVINLWPNALGSAGSIYTFTAVNPDDGRLVVIEMNPRVSRSSALASKATGFPIAKVAAKLAVGYTLDELKNEITGGATPASFEPSIDYVVTKIPRFAFEKFPTADSRLTTQMKSVGEVMAMGRTFQESFQKALRGLEVGVDGMNEKTQDREVLEKELGAPGPERIWYVGDAFALGMTVDEVFSLTRIDPWFLSQIEDIVKIELELERHQLSDVSAAELRLLKQKGFSDRRLAKQLRTTEQTIRETRHRLGVRPVYKRVDTCAAEFATRTAYMYSTYDQECEALPTQNKKIMVLGGGPNRIGQGIEFDYCCVHAALAMREDGYETIMVNCNPETVSTDYDTSDRLYFEPLTISFKVDEDFKNYLELYNWLTGIGFPDNFDQYKSIADNSQVSGEGIYSDLSLSVLTSAKNGNILVTFMEAFPTYLSSIRFTTTMSDVAHVSASCRFSFKKFIIRSIK